MTDRKHHWEKVYRDKSPLEVSWFQQEPALSLRLIADTGIGPDAPIIDVGGGASLLVDRLCEQGYTDIGVLDVSAGAIGHVKDRLCEQGYADDGILDVSGNAIVLAQDRVADRVSGVKLYEADVTAFEPPKQFALWHDRAVFHFLTSEEDRERYISALKQALEPGGHLIIMTFAIDGPNKCSGLDIVQYDAQKIKTVLGMRFDLVEAGHETHITPAGNQQKFAWFRFTRTFEKD